LFLQPLQLGAGRFLRFGFAVGFRWHSMDSTWSA
jgi:hypothetical protein